MATDKTVSYPVRIPTELDAEIQSAAEKTGISKQDLLRLCLRIGLCDLNSLSFQLPQLVQSSADELGRSFARWSKSQNLDQPCPSTTVAPTAPSTSTSRITTPIPEHPAGTVRLPPPPVVGSLLHHLNETTTTTPPPPTEQRTEIRYQKPRRKP